MFVSSREILAQPAPEASVRLRTVTPAPGRAHTCACGAPLVGGDHPRWTDCQDREQARQRLAQARYAYGLAWVEIERLSSVSYVSAEDEQAAFGAAASAERELLAASANERAVELRHAGWRTAA